MTKSPSKLSAWSEVNPKLQVVWDASSLKSFQFCPRYYEINNMQGWQGSSVDLEFGRFIATGFERFQKARVAGKSRVDALLEVVRQTLEDTWNEDGTQWGGRYEKLWKCEGTTKYKNERGNRAICPNAHKAAWFPGDPPDICVECRSGIRVENRYIPNDSAKNRHTLLRTIIWYGLHQPEDLDEGLRPYVFPDGTVAVELSGKLPLPKKSPHGEQYILAVNLDYIGQYGTELFIVDNKTTKKTLNDAYYNGFSPDTQFDTYDLYASVAFPDLPIKGVMVDAVQIMVGGSEFGLRPYYKTETQREEHLNDLLSWIDEAERAAETGYYKMNKRNCWLCPLKAVCSKPPEQRAGYLRDNFTKGERWDPSHER